MTFIRMSLSLAAVACCASVVLSDMAPQYHPVAHPSPYKIPAKPYSYEYAVNDEYLGNQFRVKQQSDGEVVNGSYQVKLPDGRIQDVSYTSDHENGFVADVTFQGEAKHPVPAPPAPYGGN
ncbi:cuticle protein 19-like [Oratosquilla oratoria]|uniref:cuticle protein 19-like n=1 Tax=Oratosquilla oratoria TaxID=337810 RepID=UPI003F769BF5